MPLYDFTCGNGHTTEHLCSAEDNEKKCPQCDSSATRHKVNRISTVFSDFHSSKNSIDVKVGRDSKQRWEHYYNKFKKKESLKLANPGVTNDQIVATSNGDYKIVNDNNKS
ncbi:zinc ribbon domain-containing protein [candidate division WWE3 bacterium]|nr:zinc ribbon domain-containing protein [candidate division WWE3 bacterium]